MKIKATEAKVLLVRYSVYKISIYGPDKTSDLLNLHGLRIKQCDCLIRNSEGTLE